MVLLATFGLIEFRVKYPLLPPRVVLNRTRGGSILAMLFASIGIFGVFLFLTYYLQGTLGFSPVKTGVAFLPMVAALAGMAQVSNRVLLPKFGPKPIIPIGLVMASAALYLLHLLGLHSSYASSRTALHRAAGPGLRSEPGPGLQHRHPRTAPPTTPGWVRPP